MHNYRICDISFEIRSGRLNLVDLAGSERLKRNGPGDVDAASADTGNVMV